MPILFIAVQCVQCSTMQVKQQKKSSNKWVCAICNQRQSVLRIHARGYLARDLRHFVQEFNLSRMKEESGGCVSSPATSDGYHIASDVGLASIPAAEPAIPAKRRFDWSEYLDPEESDQRAGYGEDSDPETLFSRHLTTELPTKKLNRPSAKRRSVEQNADPLKKLSRTLNVKGISHNTQIAAVEKKLPSKWNEYLEEEEEEEDPQKFSDDDPSDLRHHSEDYSRVDDEVHPDFL